MIKNNIIRAVKVGSVKGINLTARKPSLKEGVARLTFLVELGWKATFF